MSISERSAYWSALIGIIAHLVMILSLFLPFSSVTTGFLPSFSQTSGWEVILSSPATLFDLFIELVAFTMLFGPLLVYLGNIWLLLQQQKQWGKVQGLGAMGSTFLTVLGCASCCYIWLLMHMTGAEVATVLGPAFWVSFSAFLLSFCCSLLLAASLFRMRSLSHVKIAD